MQPPSPPDAPPVDDQTSQGALRRQYEVFPYPPPTDNDAMASGSPTHLLEIDHFLFGGRRDWTRPFRALIAGGGTGNAAIMLARQLRDIGCPAELVYIDLSTASRKIAEARAREQGLTSITFHTGSFIDLDSAQFGAFDYIDCCGVLHHLQDPPAALRALHRFLTPEGGMGLMVYGRYGRTGIYDVQDIMRSLTPNEDQTSQLTVLKSLLRELPSSNRLVQNAATTHSPNQHDSELVDKFLHPQDRAYSVPELAQLCDQAALEVVAFLPEGRYQPETYLSGADFHDRITNLPWIEQARLAELVAGNIGRHIFYVAPKTTTAQRAASLSDPNVGRAIPILKNGEGVALADRFTPDTAIKAQFEDLSILVEPPALAADILRRIDNQRSLEDIYFELAMTNSDLAWPVFLDQFRSLYSILHGLLNAMFLRFPKGA
jgi:ubiquinone/menaquinone biosynthesis C-methylase UbiE